MCFWRTSKFQYSPFWVFKLIFFRGMEMSELSSEATEQSRNLIPAPANSKTRQAPNCGIFPSFPNWLEPCQWKALDWGQWIFDRVSAESCSDPRLNFMLWWKPLLLPWASAHPGFAQPPVLNSCFQQLGKRSCVVFQLLPSAGLNLWGPRAGNSSPLNHTHELSSCKTSQLWNFSRKFWSLHHFLSILTGGAFRALIPLVDNPREQGLLFSQIPYSALRGICCSQRAMKIIIN